MHGRGGKRKFAAGLALLAGSALAVVVAWRSGENVAATVVALLVGGPALALAWAGYAADRRDVRSADTDVAAVADRLADQVGKQWSAEAKRRDLNRPPLEVSWRAADPSLTQPWPDLQRLAEAGAGWIQPAHPATGPDELAGTGRELVEVLERVPTGRLVVLGEGGAGKTMLLIRLVLDLLARRAPGGPVPLLVPLASWDPDHRDQKDLLGWLEAQIIRDHPWLGTATAVGVSRARALLDAGLILPLLDGLDEICSGGRDRAITAINNTLRDGARLVLSCRPEEFARAVRPFGGRLVHLEGAAAIHLDRLDPSLVAGYLTGTAGGAGTTRWEPVLEALAAVPPLPVAEALSTPLMASLTRTIYNPAPGGHATGLPDPAELCDTTRLPTQTAVEEHLFAGFIPAAYRPRPGTPSRWTAAQAERYLVFLAQHLERLHTTSLAWWELVRATPRLPVRVFNLAVASMFGLGNGLIAGLVAGLASGSTAVGNAAGLGSGLACWLTISIAHDVTDDIPVLGDSPPRRVPSPHRIPPLRSRVFHLAFLLWIGPVVGTLLAGLVVAGPIALTARFLLGDTDFNNLLFGDSHVLYLTVGVVGLTAGLVFGLFEGLGLEESDTEGAADPRAAFIHDRTHSLVSILVVGFPYFTVGFVIWLLAGSATGLVAGLAMNLAGLDLLVDSAWVHLGVTRLRLARRRRQPLRLMTFLVDAHGRDVLRQVGPVWEFRHTNLQRYLANHADHDM